MDQNVGITSKIENTFLAILRIVILVVLSLSLIGAIYLAFVGVMNTTATPKEFPQKEPNISELVKEFKDALKSAPESEASMEEKPAEDNSKEINLIENEISAQFKLVNDFWANFGYSLNDEIFRENKWEQASNLAFYSDDEEAFLKNILSYLKGQTEYFKAALKDEEVINFLKSQNTEYAELKIDSILSAYPSYFEKQKEEKEKFDATQAAEIMGNKAGAMMQLYFAAGLFGTFLLISLILVLVKIERNLRNWSGMQKAMSNQA